jgi:predicted secreted Zn-dependent protease
VVVVATVCFGLFAAAAVSLGPLSPAGGTEPPAASPTVEMADATPTQTSALEPTASLVPTTARTPAPSRTARPTPTPTPTLAPTMSFALPSGFVRLPDFPVSIPDVTLGYYSIYGASESALVTSMIANAKGSCEGNAIGCLRDKFSWEYSTATVSGECHVTDVAITELYIIILPRWDGPSTVPARLIPWFQTTLDNLVEHLGEHLAIARSYVPQLKAAILAGPCDSALVQKEATDLLAKIQVKQDALDLEDEDWPWPAY